MNPLLNPHEIRHCETCGTSLKGRRSDIKYCSDKCRVLGNQRKKQTQAWADARETPPTQVRPDAHTPPPQEPTEVQAEEFFTLPTYEAGKSRQARIEDLPLNVQKLFRDIDQQEAYLDSKLKKIEAMNHQIQNLKIEFGAEQELYKRLKFKQKQQQQAQKVQERKEAKMGFFVLALHSLTSQNSLVVPDASLDLEQCVHNMDKLKIIIDELKRQQNLLREEEKIARKEIGKNKNYIFRIIKSKDFLPNDTPKTKSSPTMTMPHIKRTSPEPEPETTEPYKPEPHKHTFNGTDLRRMQKASIIELPYSCNEYFGDLTRQMCFIALSGNAGAGKTHFSFFVVHCFDLIGYKVKYFSLECGISNQVIDLAKDNKLSKRFSISEKATAQDIAEAAQNFDVVVIDSFGKAFKNATEIDNLRQAYPETIFICIFQQTTEGTLRGGSAVSYDCSAEWKIIQDKENQTRTLHIIKSRYGNGGKSVDITHLDPKNYAK